MIRPLVLTQSQTWQEIFCPRLKPVPATHGPTLGFHEFFAITSTKTYVGACRKERKNDSDFQSLELRRMRGERKEQQAPLMLRVGTYTHVKVSSRMLLAALFVVALCSSSLIALVHAREIEMSPPPTPNTRQLFNVMSRQTRSTAKRFGMMSSVIF